MSATNAQSEEFVVLHGVPWDVYTKIIDALGECHLRHTYDHGTLEMRSIVYGLPWEEYERFLNALGDYSLRHTYDKGTLEMMSPLKEHDWVKKLLGRMIEMAAFELDMDVQSVGSMTLRKSRKGRGVQPDEAYYFASEPKVRFKKHYDPEVDPPPDLVIEADVTNSCIKRLPVFAAIGVPEIWHHDGEKLRFLKLNKAGAYTAARKSAAFPMLTPQFVVSFVDRAVNTKEKDLLKEFVTWIREKKE